ncbi:unnamed protein product [Didymodactylos carnosus]|uniref:Uncharacterized protein n=1 Tax=Didymodactylos carnosus TaxID=1234261 RepID=A0A814JSX2_9BILA|nr:unnamed protein product [Didymodactylos carnosus]CAF1039901.1 unnamed protein product [Didymodactylos carnosus]CAF3535263.1 unnamed protein product [Didymodactylos carnosus]CAF3810199.1 unnamed protein product [Didymodactylos carnosus]
MGAGCCKRLKRSVVHPVDNTSSDLINHTTNGNLTTILRKLNELSISVDVLDNESPTTINYGTNSSAIYEPKETSEDVIVVLFYDDSEYSSNLRQLAEQSFISHMKTFDNIERFFLYIKWIVNEKILLIIPRYYLPRLEVIYRLRTIDSIIVYQGGDDQNDRFLNAYPKIKKIFLKEQDQQLITECIKEQIKIIHKNLLEISVFDLKQNSTSQLTTESASFLWYLTVTGAFKEMNAIKNIPREYDNMIQICKRIYSSNQFELENIETFRHSYASSTALDWYKSEECTVARILKKALRIKDIYVLYSLRLFLVDLIDHLKSIEQQVTSDTIAYFSLKMTPKEISRFHNQSQTIFLICINGLLSTTLDLDSILDCLKNETHDTTHLKSVIIEIKINNGDSVAYVNGNNKREIWFNLGTVFRIENVTTDTESELTTIHLSVATKDGFDSLLNYIQKTKQEFEDTSMTVIFGRLLFSMEQYRKAHEYYHLLLHQYKNTINFSLQANIHRNIGHIYLERENLKAALIHYNHAIDLFNNSPDSIPQHLAKTLIDISKLYTMSNEDANDIDVPADHITQYAEKGIKILLDNSSASRIFEYYGILNCDNLENSLHYFQLQLQIYEETNEQSHIASTLEQIGLIYFKQNEYKQAVRYFECALQIYDIILPFNHPKLVYNMRLLALTVKNIEGNERIYWAYFRKVLEMEHSIYPEDHIKAYFSSDDAIASVIVDDNETFQVCNNRKLEEQFNSCIWFRDFDTVQCLDVVSYEYFKACNFDDCVDIMKIALEIEQELVPLPDKSVADKLKLCGVAYRSRLSSLNSEHDSDTRGDWSYLEMENEDDMIVFDGRKQIVVWIDENLNVTDKQEFFAKIKAFEMTNLNLFDNITLAIAFMMNTPFKHYQVVVQEKLADEFFETQKYAQLQNKNCNTLCVFVFEWNKNEENKMEVERGTYDKYLSYLPCSKQCWPEMLTVSERCLSISNNRTLLFNFCTRPSSDDYYILMLFNHTKTNGCWIENLTSQVVTPNRAFLPCGSLTQNNLDGVTNFVDNQSVKNFKNYVEGFFQAWEAQLPPPPIPSAMGFQFCSLDTVPEIFDYLRIPNFNEKHEKFVIQITSITLSLAIKERVLSS